MQVGYGFGIGDLPINRVYVQTIHGVRVGENFSLGLGIGINTALPRSMSISTDISIGGQITSSSSEYISTLVYMPIFLNAKVYLPIYKNTDAFFSMDLGYSLGLNQDIVTMSGLMFTPSAGVSINKRLNISVGYDIQKISFIRLLSVNSGAISLNVGLLF